MRFWRRTGFDAIVGIDSLAFGLAEKRFGFAPRPIRERYCALFGFRWLTALATFVADCNYDPLAKLDLPALQLEKLGRPHSGFKQDYNRLPDIIEAEIRAGLEDRRLTLRTQALL